MRNIPPRLAAKFDAGVTTMALAWRLTRGDGVVVAVTQHDRELTIDGTRFVARNSFIAGDQEHEVCLAPDRTALTGALSIGSITEADLALGRWQDATVEAFQVDWENPADFLIIWVGKVGGISWRGSAFELDIVGLEAALAADIGRVYARTCDAILGDARCKMDMSNAQRFTGAPIIGVVSDRVISVIAPANRGIEDFIVGAAHMLSGVTQGWQSDITHIEIVAAPPSPLWRITLARPFPIAPVAGDSVRIMIGCDKQFATCKARFANALNFRGQHTLPGDDVAFGGPPPSGNTGGKR